eukprot:356141-Chlamydomonas_euryale.AAC.5
MSRVVPGSMRCRWRARVRCAEGTARGRAGLPTWSSGGPLEQRQAAGAAAGPWSIGRALQQRQAPGAAAGPSSSGRLLEQRQVAQRACARLAAVRAADAPQAGAEPRL